MAILRLNLTEDHLKLVKFIKLDDTTEDDVIRIDRKVMLTLQTHILDDVAMVLGLKDKAIKHTTEDPDGAAYPDDVEKYMLDTYNYVSENLPLIESLLHQRVMEGVQPGEYKCKDYEMVWEVVHINKARQMAEEMELDLVEINGRVETPILKICNYEKMIYELKKAEKKNKQNAKPLKEIQLSANIAKHDLETKANNARKFLEDGSKVKVVLSMRGRELARREENKKSILEFIVMLEEVAVTEGGIKDEGNRTIVILKKKQNQKQ